MPDSQPDTQTDVIEEIPVHGEAVETMAQISRDQHARELAGIEELKAEEAAYYAAHPELRKQQPEQPAEEGVAT